jgi:trehalose 6-phosphate phosphatase
MRRLHGIGVHKIVGNHGAEPWHGTNRPVNKNDRWRRSLGERLSGLRGVKIEDKGFSIAIHYRQSREKKLARSAILEAVSALGEIRLIGGRQVINILPQGAPHKGMALERERALLKCDTAIYVGDDETDEDVFALDQPGQLLTIRVGQRRSSAAAYFIESQRRIDDLLRILLKLRQEVDIVQPA